MLNREAEYMWKILQKNNCIDAYNITHEMRCTICGKVMINSHRGLCGCRYCLECVTEHLKGGNEICNGNGENCKNDLMVIDKTVFPDPDMNQAISKLVVKCPRDGCEFTGALEKMEEHEYLCNTVAQSPFCTVGSSRNEYLTNKSDENLSRENESHSGLLIGLIGQLQREMGAMRRDFAGLVVERREQQKMSELQAEKIEQLGRAMQALERENRLMKEQIITLAGVCATNPLVAVQVEFPTQRKDEVQATPEKRDEERATAPEIDQLQEKLLIEGKTSDSEPQAAEKTDELRNTQVKCDELASKVRDALSKCDYLMKRAHENWIKVESREESLFVWQIREWTERRRELQDDPSKEVIWSDAFSLHEQGYRMCLCLRRKQSEYYFGWQLLRGPFDEWLSWPFRGNVTVAIADPVHHCYLANFTVRQDQHKGNAGWKRPKRDRNAGFYNATPVKEQEILNMLDVLLGDRVLIKCFVEMYQ